MSAAKAGMRTLQEHAKDGNFVTDIAIISTDDYAEVNVDVGGMTSDP